MVMKKKAKKTMRAVAEVVPKKVHATLVSLNKELLEAARKGNFQGVKNALKRGADKNAKDKGGLTVLGYANFGHKDATVKLLERHGAK